MLTSATDSVYGEAMEKHPMKSTNILSVVILAAISLLQLPACSSRKEAPDPAAVQEQIADYQAQEIDLIRSTVLDDDRADRLIALMDQRDRLISEHVKEIVAYRKEMSTLNANYYAQRESFSELVSTHT